MTRDFRALNKYAHREYKFVQRESYSQVEANYGKTMSNGVCMGVVLNWVKEKLTTSNGLRRSDGPLLNPATRRFSNSLNPLSRIRNGISPPTHSVLGKLMGKQPDEPRGRKSGPRNETAMLEGAHTQKDYRHKAFDQLVSDLKLVRGAYKPDEKTRQVVYSGKNEHTGRPNRLYLSERAHDEMIAMAGHDLPKGNAIVLDLKQQAEGPGHAVAFYKSRGGTLYFFDPNAGVYEISRPHGKNLSGFVQAWLEVYTNDRDANGNATPRHWMTREGERWYSVYIRTGDKRSENQAEADARAGK
ncbi:YopT-type cysteine protease domain-containing protein [Paraburkholderia sp. J76]|uniref:YopT-type cysteine protease domain-containing protein n=1 Tax=Paraburkholderia sp. J76 TaxID=2805439 RepID=UPI002ABDB528|nr:YopT-type cysteine protease domain-containing protein [Paraburkholderia sp. J76]